MKVDRALTASPCPPQPRRFAMTPDDFRRPALLNLATEFPDDNHPGRVVAWGNKEEMRARLAAVLGKLGVGDPNRTASQMALIINGAYVTGLLEPFDLRDDLVDAAVKLSSKRSSIVLTLYIVAPRRPIKENGRCSGMPASTDRLRCSEVARWPQPRRESRRIGRHMAGHGRQRSRSRRRRHPHMGALKGRGRCAGGTSGTNSHGRTRQSFGRQLSRTKAWQTKSQFSCQAVKRLIRVRKLGAV